MTGVENDVLADLGGDAGFEIENESAGGDVTRQKRDEINSLLGDDDDRSVHVELDVDGLVLLENERRR